MQVELLDPHRWKTRIELTNAIFGYLKIWHNRRRHHSAQLSPDSTSIHRCGAAAVVTE